MVSFAILGTTFNVKGGRTDPNGIKAHILDIVEL